MDMDTIALHAFGVVTIFCMLKVTYDDQRLKRYVKRHYPEEGKNIRRWYEVQLYPCALGCWMLRTLIKKERANDPQLARLARKSKLSIIYCTVCPIVMFLMSFIYYVLLKTGE